MIFFEHSCARVLRSLFSKMFRNHIPRFWAVCFILFRKVQNKNIFCVFALFEIYFHFFQKCIIFRCRLWEQLESQKVFLRKKSARKNFFSLFFARFALFLKNIFLKINFFLRKGAFQAPASQKYFLSNHFCNSSCSHNRENLFLHFCVFSKKNIFFKKKFLFFTFFQKCTFEIFREKKYFLGNSKKFCKVRASLLSRLFYFFLFCTKNNFFCAFWEIFFEKNIARKHSFFALEKRVFIFFHKIHFLQKKTRPRSARDFFENFFHFCIFWKLFSVFEKVQNIFYFKIIFFHVFQNQQKCTFCPFLKTENRTG